MTRHRTAGWALLCVLAASAPAFAQDPPPPDCKNPVTQFDLNACADEDYQTADKALNAAYRTAMGRATATDKDLGAVDQNLAGAADALKTAQRAWIGYRDGQCALAGFEARGGSMESMLVSNCLADVTRKRTRELDETLKPQ